jgi:hypothetical protein
MFLCAKARRFLVLIFSRRGPMMPGFSFNVKNDERKISNVSRGARACAKSAVETACGQCQEVTSKAGRCHGNCKEVYVE